VSLSIRRKEALGVLTLALAMPLRVPVLSILRSFRFSREITRDSKGVRISIVILLVLLLLLPLMSLNSTKCLGTCLFYLNSKRSFLKNLTL